jgi:hypothetical protein
MRFRTALLLSFLIGTVIGAAVLWLMEDPATPSATRAPRASNELETPDPVAMRMDPECPEPCEEEIEGAPLELTREQEGVTPRAVEAESRAAPQKPVPDYWGRGRNRNQRLSFDAGALQAIGFSPESIEWIRGRWEQAEIEKSYLTDLEANGEDPPRGGGLSDIERELREDLGDNDYDAMLYATHQSNRVALENVRKGAIANRAGLRSGTVVWSYDGQRVFDHKELVELSTSGKRGEPVEIEILSDDGTENLYVERGPLGAELVTMKQPPSPN